LVAILSNLRGGSIAIYFFPNFPTNESRHRKSCFDAAASNNKTAVIPHIM
jgi:hypothetical protein